MKNVVLLALAAISLGACTTTSPAVRVAEHQQQCVSYGFQAGTDTYANCMMQLDLYAQEQDARKRRAIGEALSEMGRNMQANRPVTCNTYGNANRLGSTVYGNSTTTCY